MTTNEPLTSSSDELVDELKKKRRNRNLIIGAVVVGLAVLVGCCMLVVSFVKDFAGNIGTGNEVLTEFLQAMSEKDVDSAYALMSERAKVEVSRDDLQELVDGANFVLFDGFEDLTITSTHQRTTTNFGTYLEIEGIVLFEHEFRGSLEAIVHKEGEEWKITSVNVTVPPDKMEAFLEKNGD